VALKCFSAELRRPCDAVPSLALLAPAHARTLSALDALAGDAFKHEGDALALVRAEEAHEHVVHPDRVPRDARGRRPQHQGLDALRQGLLGRRGLDRKEEGKTVC